MTRTLYRKSGFMRVMSTIVALSFTLSLTGFGYAAPAKTSVPTSDQVVTSAKVGTPAATSVASGEPVTQATQPTDAAATTGGNQSTTPGITDQVAPAPVSSGNVLSPAGAAAPSPTVVSLAPYASTATNWEAWRLSPSTGWVKANLGAYREGDWIPTRIYVDNSKGATDLRFPGFEVAFDGLNSNKNAVAVDSVRGFRYYAGASLPGDQPYPAGSSDISSLFSFGFDANLTYYNVTMAQPPSGSDLVIPAGGYGVVYFQAHLAITQYWQSNNPKHNGAKSYPGSSAQGRFVSWNGTGTGEQTISIPVGPGAAPQGEIVGLKFKDLNGDGVMQSGEPPLGGWTFTLTFMDPNFGFSTTGVTSSDPADLGKFHFTGLPEGPYQVTETLKPNWTNTTPIPVSLTLGHDETGRVVAIGNRIPDVNKTWSLAIDALPSGATAWVAYKLDGVAKTVTLSGSGPFTAVTPVPSGSVITDIAWYVTWNGIDVLLGSNPGPETITQNTTNSLTYDSAVSGMKFSDLNGDGVKQVGEPGLSGWTISLYRIVNSNEVLYASAITDVNGAYSFADVIPGTYVVHETQQSGWYNTVAPAGSFTVSNGSHVSGKDFGNLHVSSAITVTKTGPAMAHVGDVVNYTIVVTNDGNYALTNVMVDDSRLGLHVTIPVLAAHGSVTYNLPYTVQANDPDPLPNTVTAVGIDILGFTVSGQASHLVDILKPAIEVTKTASVAMATNPASILYTYVVHNSGEETLAGVVLTDDHFAIPGGAIGTLAPGASVTITVPQTLTVSTTNVATVSGHDALGMTVSAHDDATVAIYNPSISIVKSANPTVVLPGGTVVYTYLVTNTGDIALSNVRITDDKIAGVYPVTPAILAPGQTGTVTLSSSIPSDVTNIGIAYGDYGTPQTSFFGTVTAQSSASVDVVHPAIHVTKTPSATEVVTGSSVTYTYVVTNTGDVALHDVVLSDDHLTVPGGSIGSLDPGQSVTLQASAVLTSDTTNIATVVGHDVWGHGVTDSATASVVVHHPSISIVKSAAPDTILSGDTVTYTYLVTNTGDVPLMNVHVTDDKIPGSFAVTPSTLLPGQSGTASASSAVLVDTTNVGTAHGTYGTPETSFFGEVTASDEASVNMVAPAVSIVKSASPSMVVAGGSVTYTFTVTNTGDVPLFDVAVDDAIIGYHHVIGMLSVGQVVTLSTTVTLSETTTNVAVVTGHDAEQHPVTDSDEVTVPVYNPSISIVKSADPANVLPGDMVTYTYLVTNTGDIPLTDVRVTDDHIPGVFPVEPSVLLPGESGVVVLTAPISVDTTNIGIAYGDYGTPETDFFGTVTAASSASVDVVHPAIAVAKLASAARILNGENVTYTYVVTNTGDVTLFNVLVVDDHLGTIGTIPELGVGASASLSASTALTVTTTNVVTVTAIDANEHPVSATAAARVEVFNPSISIVKTAAPDIILAGEQVTYTYVVTNTGDIALNDVAVTDDVLGAIGIVGTLLPGESATLSKGAPISVDTTNVGTATGTYGEPESSFFGSVSASDNAVVDVVHPAIAVTKSASPTGIFAGDTVTYTYTVTNTGDVPLNGVMLVDDKLGTVGSVEVLGVEQSQTFTASTTLSTPTTNTVVASGTDAYGHEVSDEASAFVDVALPFTPPDVTIVKSADHTTAKPGDLVTYTLTYRNIGPSPASEIVITDDYDQRYMTIVDSGGGTVADGKITWNVAGPLYAEDGAKTITYTARINSTMPAGTTLVKNTVVIFEPTDTNHGNDTSTWTVRVGEPFLPFTGGDWTVLAIAALIAAAAGLALRRLGRSAS